MAGQWSHRNPAVRRILQELREMEKEDDPNLLAEAIEENIFEWHFVIRGAWDSEFEGGIYHGRILMPAEYPFKPPAFVMLTPSGRFETGVKICLSISSHHPESWQPSWSVRSALVALIAFMQTPGNGALGSLDHPTAARCQMAAESRTRPPAYGSAERQELIATMHQRMLDLEERSRALLRQEKPPAESPAAETAEAAAAEAEAPAAEAEPAASPAGAVVAEPAAAEQQAQQQEAAAAPAAAAPALGAAASAAARPAALPAPAAEPELRQRPAAAGAAAVVQPLWQEPPLRMPQPMHGREVEPTTDALRRADDRFARQRTGVPPQSWEDRSLTYLAVVLALCIGALVIRKVLVAFTVNDDLFTFNHVEGVEL